jgi:acetophenone carboxylase
MSIADNSIIQTPQPLFGGYSQCTCPGLSMEGVDIPELLRAGDEGRLDLASLLEGKFGGRIVSESYGRTARPVGADQVITLGISTGGTGYGDPLDRDPEAVERDLTDGMISEWAARNVYGVRFNPQTGRVDLAGTEELRAERMRARIAGGRTWDDFHADWSTRKPPEEILGLYGSWPDAAVVTPLMRM